MKIKENPRLNDIDIDIDLIGNSRVHVFVVYSYIQHLFHVLVYRGSLLPKYIETGSNKKRERYYRADASTQADRAVSRTQVVAL
jgi:hypothetical protein